MIDFRDRAVVTCDARLTRAERETGKNSPPIRTDLDNSCGSDDLSELEAGPGSESLSFGSGLHESAWLAWTSGG